MKVSIFLKITVLCLLITIISCGGKTDQKKNLSPQEEEQGLLEDSGVETMNVKKMNEAAKSVLEYRYKEYGKDPVAAIEMDRWYFEFIAVGADIRKAGFGEWIDMYPDMTYEYGDSTGVVGKGRYHFNVSDNTLLLVDDDARMKPKEYEAKIIGPTMVLVGKPTYKDNNMQMKLAMDNIGRYKFEKAQ